MRKYLFIGAGGFAGAVLRFYIKGIHIFHYKETMPLNTLIINVVGCFILGLFLTVAIEVWEISANIRLGIATGLFGAFTTFSTLCKEAYILIIKGDYYSAISYVTLSIMLGTAAVFFGIVIAREIISKYAGKGEAENPEEEYAINELDGEVS